MMELTPIIPNYALKDTLAVLAILLALPPTVSVLFLVVYVLATMGSRRAVSWASRLLLHSNVQTTTLITTTATPKDKQDETHSVNNLSALILILLSDLCICITLKVTGPVMAKIAFVLAKAIIAGSLCGGDWISVLTASLIALSSDRIFSFVSTYISHNFGISITSQHSLFPHLSSSNFHLFSFISSLFSSYPQLHHKFQIHSIESYKALLSLSFKFVLDVLNLLLAIHIVLIAFASVFKNNIFSRSINQFSISSSDFQSHSVHPVMLKDRTRDLKLLTVELSPEQADTPLISENEQNYSMEAPASYPEDETSDILSSRNIVADNFENFCLGIQSRVKNSTKFVQPLWTFMATLKAMSIRKDIYSGEIQAKQGDNNALVLSDYVNKYDDYVFANFDQCFKRNKILIFVDYIGETLISFQLKNYKRGDIIIRVNGVIWYQVSRGDHKGEEYFIVGGLTPLSQYDVQFIIEEEDELGNKKKYLIDDLIVSTIDKDGGNISTVKTTSNKVLSPLVTLQESLITTTDNLNQEKLKLKKQRKEISKKLTSYRQEIEKLKGKISSSDSNDLKNWNKVTMLRISVKQAEEDVSKVENEISLVEARENEVYEVYVVEKRKFDQQLRNFQNFRNVYTSKMELKRTKLSELNLELDNLSTKKEKLQIKADKFTADLSKVIGELNELYMNDLTAKITARQSRLDKRVGLLGEFTKEIEKMKKGCDRLELENSQLRLQLKS
jgi:predicted  nucleic acid-binding Zn-ribbon protein